MQGCPLISLPGRWHQSRDLCVPGRWQRFLPAHEVPFGLAHPPSNQGMHLPLTCGREVAFPRPAPLPHSKLGFLPAPDFLRGESKVLLRCFVPLGAGISSSVSCSPVPVSSALWGLGI